MSRHAAILIVNGGQDPAQGRWLEKCLGRIARHTLWPDYGIYVWNNNVDDEAIPALVGRYPQARLFQADPAETLDHPHAVPLQRLYEAAREAARDEAAVIVTLDSDAFPIKDGWLTHLVDATAACELGGVWRDELQAAIPPYVHASCLCTTVAFVERHQLRFDFFDIDPDTARKYDTLAVFTARAEAAGVTPHKLKRSNKRELHRLMGGIYGDTIYHHGAGSRVGVGFWDEHRSAERKATNRKVRDLAAELLFEHESRLIDWLRGANSTPVPLPPLSFILGMHRSGTSCLAGSLERCGLFLGDVSRQNRFNPRGNHELPDVIALNDAILAHSGGSWSAPPATIAATADQQSAAAAIVASLAAEAPAGLKDPRLLLTTDAWLPSAAPPPAYFGSYRHPLAVAASLARRDGMPQAEALALWNQYNAALLALYDAKPFPIVKFDLSDPAAYVKLVLALAFERGLSADPVALGQFVSASLDSSGAAAPPIPATCRPIWDRLEALAAQPAPPADRFAACVRTIWEIQAAFAAGTPAVPVAAPKAATPKHQPRRRPALPRRAWRKFKRWVKSL